MKHRSLLTALALAASVAACADGSPLGNAPAARPTVPSHLVGSNYVNQNTSATPLSVSISGPGTRVLAEDTVTLTGSASGGTGPYWYQWIAQPCYEDGYCREPYVFAEGSGINSAKLLVRSDEYVVNVSLQVHEDREVHLSGVYKRKILGPAAWDNGTGTSFNFTCHTSFPHHDWTYDPGSGDWKDKGTYARSCLGAKIPNPNP